MRRVRLVPVNVTSRRFSARDGALTAYIAVDATWPARFGGQVALTGTERLRNAGVAARATDPSAARAAVHRGRI